MRYIETLREGERINEIYLCKNKQPSVTKAGKPFVSLTMQDKTGTLDAKIWDPGSLGIRGCYQLSGGAAVKYQAYPESTAGGI